MPFNHPEEIKSFGPLSQASFKLEKLLFEAASLPSRLINVLLYAFIGGLIFLILRALLGSNEPIAIMATLLFVAHPIHTEVLANISYRDELFALLFGLVSWGCFLKNSSKLNWVWLICGMVAFTLALLSKVSIAPLVIIIPFSLWFFKNGSIAYYAVTFLTLFTTLSVYVILGANQLLSWDYLSGYSTNASWSIGQTLSSAGYYIKLAFVPWPLSSYYGYNTIPFSGWGACPYFIYIGSVAIVLIAAVGLTMKRRLAGFGLLFLVIAIIPISSVFYPTEELIIERGLFTPSFGICLFIAAVFHWIGQKTHAFIGRGVFILLCIVFTALSTFRTSQWKTYETLINADISSLPTSAKLSLLNGDYYFSQIPKHKGVDRTELARKSIKHLLVSSKLEPTWERTHQQLGVLYDRELNEPFEALPHFERSLKLNPRNFTSAFDLAGCYAQMGMQDSALYFIKKTLDINPEHYESLEFLTSHYFKIGNVQLGFGFANRFINIYPQSDIPYLILADYYFKNEKEEAAINHLEIAAKKNPINKETLKVLFNYYYNKGDFERAEQYRDLAIYN